MHKGNFIELSAAEGKTGKLIVNAAYVVHKTPGSGLLEKVYEVCFCHVLSKDGIKRFIFIIENSLVNICVLVTWWQY